MSGVRDLVAVAKAQQIPGADTLEKLMEMAGPIVDDLVRQIEHPLQRLGDWRKAYYFQFYTRPRMIQVTGPDGVEIDKQYMPEALKFLRPNTPPDSVVQKVLSTLDEFRYHVTESGINEIHRMTNKLLYLQMMKLGFPISWWTMAKVAKIPNFGPPPAGANTEMERWVAQQRIQIEMEVQKQVIAAEMLGGVPGAGAGPPGGGGPPSNGNGNQPGAPSEEGRPPSFNAPPRLESKDGGMRTTISTSR